MSDTPNYKASTVTGDQYTRAVMVRINNPLGEIPSIEFTEEEILNLPGRTLRQYAAVLECQMDPENQLHLDIYAKLNELYTVLRDARDATPPTQPE